MHSGGKLSRRGFVGSILGLAAAGLTLRIPWTRERGAEEPRPRANAVRGGIPHRPLGKTGVSVSAIGLGGQITLETSGRRDEAVEIINRAIDLGIDYVDTAAVYGRGVSERYIGEVMRHRRREVFLASKTLDRSYDGSMRILEKSLKQLQTDRLDLWQLHDVRTKDDLDFIFARHGALRALERARVEGTVRFVGITGHRDPLVLKTAIERFPFDTILMALNAADINHPASFIKTLLPVAVEKQMGILAMKVPSRGRIFRPGGITTMEQALGYVLSLPVSSAIVGLASLSELEQNVRLARTLQPFSGEKMASLEALTAPYVREANWYKDEW